MRRHLRWIGLVVGLLAVGATGARTQQPIARGAMSPPQEPSAMTRVGAGGLVFPGGAAGARGPVPTPPPPRTAALLPVVNELLVNLNVQGAPLDQVVGMLDQQIDASYLTRLVVEMPDQQEMPRATARVSRMPLGWVLGNLVAQAGMTMTQEDQPDPAAIIQHLERKLGRTLTEDERSRYLEQARSCLMNGAVLHTIHIVPPPFIEVTRGGAGGRAVTPPGPPPVPQTSSMNPFLREFFATPGVSTDTANLPLPWPISGTLYYRSAPSIGPSGMVGASYSALRGRAEIDALMPSRDADPSPVSGDIAWSRVDQPGSDLPILVDRGDGRQVAVTKQAGVGGINAMPRWSLDGKKIAFQHTEVVGGREGKPHAWIVSADGRYAHPAAAKEGPSTTNPLWLPDGKGVLVNVQGKPHKYEIRLADGSMRPRPEFDGAVRWSPDGKKLAALVSRRATRGGRVGQLNQLVIRDPRGRLLKVVAEVFLPDAEVRKHYPTEDQLRADSELDWIDDINWWVGPMSPQWSPEGDKIAFLAALPFNPGGKYYREQPRVWIYDLKSGKLVRVTNDSAAQYQLVWSRRQKK